jgi:hypothetical protein
MRTTVSVTLVYENGTTWFAGTFNCQADADAWIATEQTRPYWAESTQIEQVVTVTE